MEIKAFRVQMYRCILDSDWIEVTPLTVVVGKNEAGKTTLLRALQKFNPF
jgi:AAA15 family ATPase/GTPase